MPAPARSDALICGALEPLTRFHWRGLGPAVAAGGQDDRVPEIGFAKAHKVKFRTISGPVEVNIATRAALDAAVVSRFRAGKGFALATLNLDHLVKLVDDRDFAMAYLAQDFVVADGNPVVWLSRLARQPVDLMPGADLVVPLARLAADENVSVALIGSTSAALEQAASALQSAVPNLTIAVCIAPPMEFDAQGAAAEVLLKQAAQSGAGMAFLALGAPKQELLAARARNVTPKMAMVSIGAGLDFLAGTQHRAPKLLRMLALEWVWRLMQNPTRLTGRYLRCIAIMPRLIGQSLSQPSDKLND